MKKIIFIMALLVGFCSLAKDSMAQSKQLKPAADERKATAPSNSNTTKLTTQAPTNTGAKKSTIKSKRPKFGKIGLIADPPASGAATSNKAQTNTETKKKTIKSNRLSSTIGTVDGAPVSGAAESILKRPIKN